MEDLIYDGEKRFVRIFQKRQEHFSVKEVMSGVQQRLGLQRPSVASDLYSKRSRGINMAVA